MLEAFADLSAPLVAGACLRCGVPLRAADPGIRPVVAGQRTAGRVLPVRHYGSVDVFVEAFGRAQAGDVLVIGNGGRLDEACAGDLAVLEAEAAGVAALVVRGLHRDAPELAAIGLPVFSYGSYPAGPARLEEREPGALVTARFGPQMVSASDIAFADDDGVLFVAAQRAEQVLVTAQQIWQGERDQARRIRQGQTLRRQTGFDDYLARRAADPSCTFRRHLRRIGGVIEEQGHLPGGGPRPAPGCHRQPASRITAARIRRWPSSAAAKCGHGAGQMPARPFRHRHPARGGQDHAVAIVLTAAPARPRLCGNPAAADSRPGNQPASRHTMTTPESRCPAFRPARRSARTAGRRGSVRGRVRSPGVRPRSESAVDPRLAPRPVGDRGAGRVSGTG